MFEVVWIGPAELWEAKAAFVAFMGRKKAG
jgi:hypothetical protein